MADAGERASEADGPCRRDAATRCSKHQVEQLPTLVELGLKKWQARKWQAVASLPQNEYDQYKKEAREGGEITEREELLLHGRFQRRDLLVVSEREKVTSK